MGRAAGVSRRRSKNRNPKFHNKNKLRRKREKLTGKCHIGEAVIKKVWDEKKRVEDNLTRMGLVVDPNKVIGLPKPYETLGLPAPMDVDGMSSVVQKKKKQKKKKNKKSTSVIESLEQKAALEQPKNFNLSPDMAKMAVYMIEKHGQDYEAMQRDKANIYQLSSGTIKKTIKQFLKIPANVASYEKAKLMAQEAIEEQMNDQ